MTEKQAWKNAIILAQRYWQLLHSTGQTDGDKEFVAGLQPELLACEEEFAGLLEAHPQLFEQLKQKYRMACKGYMQTKNLWPTKDATANPSDLMKFAYEENLNLFGAPRELPNFGRARANRARAL